ncbi:MAG TPA: Flp pilus assembly protein CpaB [Jatrophihabitans sp.]|nr:Flp pilus assembly protein CpaB [Jatrophihabitans sp.]
MLRNLLASAHPHLRSPLGRWVRIGAAILCLLFAGAAALGAASRPDRAAVEPSASVVVAARMLPAGLRLRADDLRVAQWPRSLRPAGAAQAATDLVGSRLAGPVGPGEPITRLRLAGSALTAGLSPGTVATPVLVGGDVGDLVRAGDRVDLIAAPPSPLTSRLRASPAQASVVASGVAVLAVPRPRAADPLGGSATQLVLATDRATALRIAALQAARTFTVVVDRP